MRRFYLQVYLTFLGILLLLGLLISVSWFLLPDSPADQRRLDAIGALVSTALPGPERPDGELQAAVQRLADDLSAGITVRGVDETILASAGGPRLGSGEHWRGWPHGRRAGPAVSFPLPDGRRVLVRWWYPRRPGGLLAVLLLAALAVGIGAYPVVRRLTRRLERLQAKVDALGAGDLRARVPVEGKDEVAELAHSFNRAAGRIERLVNSQRSVLAAASHELRSPLARIRVGLELLSSAAKPQLGASLAQDIADLDELIGELLLASRLDAFDQLERSEAVDLLALLAEESARTGAEVSGERAVVHGDPRLLRRLLRNLLENARRYAGGSMVEASVAPLNSNMVRVLVVDRGPGVAEEERERIFEPFYRPVALQESGEGTGLGLALVRQIAHHHGGTVHCQPREGGGTCFEVHLPRAGELAGPGR
jgi:signal transduction histidine kinase